MKGWLKVAAASAVVLAAGSAGAAGAVVSGLVHGPTSAARITPAASLASSVQSTFVPIGACRIVDTRVTGAGGPLIAGTGRDFVALGTRGFRSQGGQSGGCGIPSSATTLSVAFEAVNATVAGSVREAAYGGSYPTAPLLQYVPGQTTETTPTFLVTNGYPHFSLKASAGQTDVVVDVLGYYVPGLLANIDVNGDVIAASRVVDTAHLDTGLYEVTFDRDISNCVPSAVPSGLFETLQPTIFSSTPSTVQINIYNSSGDPVDDGFSVSVAC